MERKIVTKELERLVYEFHYENDQVVYTKVYDKTTGKIEIERTLVEGDLNELKVYYENYESEDPLYDGLHYKVMQKETKWDGDYTSWWINGKLCCEAVWKDDKQVSAKYYPAD